MATCGGWRGSRWLPVVSGQWSAISCRGRVCEFRYVFAENAFRCAQAGADGGADGNGQGMATEPGLHGDQYWRRPHALVLAAHPLVAVEAGDRVVPARFPFARCVWRVLAAAGWRKGGDRVSWPVAMLANGARTEPERGPTTRVGHRDKLFAGRSANWRVGVRWSGQGGCADQSEFRRGCDAVPGLWICYGGWPERPGPKQMCVALEPATAPVELVSASWTVVAHFGSRRILFLAHGC